jgi:hypothetical protein
MCRAGSVFSGFAIGCFWLWLIVFCCFLVFLVVVWGCLLFFVWLVDVVWWFLDFVFWGSVGLWRCNLV